MSAGDNGENFGVATRASAAHGQLVGKTRTYSDAFGQRFGRLVKRLRSARGLTQEQLAERSKLAADTIRRLERGTFSPSLETLHKLSVGLDSNLTTLFSSFEGGDDAAAREALAIARNFTGLEIALALRVLALLSAMVSRVAEGTDDG